MPKRYKILDARLAHFVRQKAVAASEGKEKRLQRAKETLATVSPRPVLPESRHSG